MFAPVFTALVWVALQAPSGTLRLSDAALVVGRRSQIENGSAMDVEDTPRIETDLLWPTWKLSLDYAPRLTWVDVVGSNPSPALLLHSASLQLSLRQPRYTLSLTQIGVLGDQNFYQAAAPPLTTQPAPTIPGEMRRPELSLLPRAQFVRVAAEETTADLQYDWTRRWRSELVASVGFSGGADAEARQFLPQQHTASLDAGLTFRRSRVDELGTVLNGTQIETSNGYRHRLASVLESWALNWSANSGSELGLGAAVHESTAPDGSISTQWVPVGSASLTRALLLRDAQARFQWSVGYGPSLNVLLGTLQSRLSATAQAALTVQRTSLSLTLGAAQTFPTDAPDSARLLSAALALDHELSHGLRMQLGGQITGQRFVGDNASESAGSFWVLYAGLEGRVPEIRF